MTYHLHTTVTYATYKASKLLHTYHKEKFFIPNWIQ